MRRVAVLALLLAGCGGSDPVEERWVTYRDTSHAFSITYPESWKRAAQPLTPGLTNPREIFSAGTRYPRPGGEHCHQVPETAMREMGRGDVLLTLLERRGSGGFEERIHPYRLGPTPSALGDECAERTDLRASQIGFRDAGRGLHVYAVLGPGATGEKLERVVESLRLSPAWRSRRLDLRLQPPTGWSVATRGRTIAIGSGEVARPPGDACPGAPALADGGAYVMLTESRGRRPRPHFTLRDRDRRAYECFGDSWRFDWRDAGRTFRAHAYLGPRASPLRRAELLAALKSIVALRAGAP